MGQVPQSSPRRGFGADPLWVIAEHDEELGCGVGSDAVCVSQCRRRLGADVIEYGVVGGALRCRGPASGVPTLAVSTSPRLLGCLLSRSGSVSNG